MMYCTPPETRTAKKPHVCMNCGEPIAVGETYQRWMCVDDGKGCTNKMHPECLDDLQRCSDGYEFEYTLYGGERSKQ